MIPVMGHGQGVFGFLFRLPNVGLPYREGQYRPTPPEFDPHCLRDRYSVHLLAVHPDAGGQFAEQTFSSTFSIGRDPACDIHIPEPVVSRQHAEVVLLVDTWWIQ
ncbi:FHA domain-containing protein, partial [Desulfobulbus sp. US1]|nr:FHA domain-containing protein [Desulfobulbus sp. US1]